MFVHLMMWLLAGAMTYEFVSLFNRSRYFRAFFLLAVVLSVLIVANNACADDKTPWVSTNNVTKLDVIKPGNLTFVGTGNEPLIVFKTDGTVWANPNLKPDETARKVLEIIKKQFPTLCQANAGRVDVEPSQGIVK